MKISLCLTKHSAMTAYGDVRFGLYLFLTLALAGGKWSVQKPDCTPPPDKIPKSHRYLWNRRLPGFRNQSGRSEIEKNILPLQGIQPWFLGPPAHSLAVVPTRLTLLKKASSRDTEYFYSLRYVKPIAWDTLRAKVVYKCLWEWRDMQII
jgi:hypothetical protein